VKTVDELVDFSRNIEGQGIEDHPNCTYKSAELTAFASALVTVPFGARILEIGVFAGRSASLFFQMYPDLNLDIHLVDLWTWMPDRALPVFNNLVLEHFADVPFTLHRMRSDHLGPRWNLPIDLLHIDGWHDMDGVEPDCRNFLPHIVSGGIVVFHDREDPNVSQCIERFVVSQGWENLALAGGCGVWRKP
jgi:predicted O-methyltransferase YrrM